MVIALVIAPVLTIVAVIILGLIGYLIRNVLESAISVGDDVVTANEDIQRIAQAGTEGIRDVKLFHLKSDFISSFSDAVGE